jgi:hypothetical protein
MASTVFVISGSPERRSPPFLNKLQGKVEIDAAGLVVAPSLSALNQ